MSLRGLVLIVILTSSDAADPACDHCNLNGPWWPLFKPSQIIHSDFPEHAQFRSIDRQFVSNERTSQEQRGAQVVSLGSKEAGGIDSPVKTSSSQGKQRLEWDHYGDISRVTVAYNSLEESGVNSRESRPNPAVAPEGRTPANSLEVTRTSLEDPGSAEGPSHKDDDVPENEQIVKSQEGRFFDEGSFFEEKEKPETDTYPRDFGISKESSVSEEAEEPSNSVEHDGSSESIEPSARAVATSFSSVSSSYSKVRPVAVQSRTPHFSYNNFPNHITSQGRAPVSRFQYFNGQGVSQQHLVHDNARQGHGTIYINQAQGVSHQPVPQGNARHSQGTVYMSQGPDLSHQHLTLGSARKIPGTLYINHGQGRSVVRSSIPSQFVPRKHPVYRYVKDHGGLLHQYQQPISRSTSLRWQDVNPELRGKFPFNNLQPQIQNQGTVVHHATPKKDSYSDVIWKESRIVGNLKQTPLDRNFYVSKKKPNVINLKKIGRTKGNSYFYIIRSDKRLS